MISKEAKAARVAAGLCSQCGATRGEDGTRNFCRRCANMSIERCNRCRQKKVDRGLCSVCSTPRVEGDAERTCRACVNRSIAARKIGDARRGKRQGMSIRVNGRCLNCCVTFPYQDEYESCDICSFKHLADIYLGSRRHWKEIKAIWDKQDGICPYTGLQLEFGIDASIDHILPSSRFPELVRDISNMEFIHNKVNLMKGDLTKDEFIEFLTMLSLNLRLSDHAETEDPYGLFTTVIP